jgi:hypothetical protein
MQAEERKRRVYGLTMVGRVPRQATFVPLPPASPGQNPEPDPRRWTVGVAGVHRIGPGRCACRLAGPVNLTRTYSLMNSS